MESHATKVEPPRHGLRWRFNDDRIDGTFYVGKRRLRRLLAMLPDIQRTPAGRLRTEAQQRAVLFGLWEERARELQTELDGQVGENRPISKVMGEWKAQKIVDGRAA